MNISPFYGTYYPTKVKIETFYFVNKHSNNLKTVILYIFDAVK